MNSNSTIASTAPHTFIPNNDIISYPWKTEILSNTLETNSSTQIEHQLVGSSLFSEPDSLRIDRIMKIKQEEEQQEPDHFQPQINICEALILRQQLSVSINPHNSIANNNSPVLSIKQETNSSYQINLTNSNELIISTAPMTPWPSMLPYDENPQIQHQLVETNLFPEPVPLHIFHDRLMNIKQEQFFHTTVRDHFQRRINIHQSSLLRQPPSVSIAPHNSISNNNSSVLNIKQETNISDQINLANSNELIVSTALMTPWPSMLPYDENPQIKHQLVETNLFPEPVPLHIFHDRLMNIKQEQFFHTTVSDHFQRRINIQQSSLLRQPPSVSIAPHNSISNNNSSVLNIKQETNSSDQINLANSNEVIVSTDSQNSMSNNCHMLNIKQEKNLRTNVREMNSSDQVDSVNSNESTLANKPLNLMVEQNPINKANDNIVSIVRKTPDFCIRKLPKIKNGFCNDDDDQTSQNNFIFICTICKYSPSTDIHSFALHMSDHSECNKHECIVCDKQFKSVILWTDHMTYHQQQIDLNVSTVQFNPIETDSNTLDPIHSGNMERQDFRNLRNAKCNLSILDDSHSDITRVTSTKKMIHHYDCSTCKKIFHSKSALQVHQTLHNKSQPFACRYCDKIFSRKSPCTNHEKSHKMLLQNNENIKLKPTVIQNSISLQDNNNDSDTMSIKQKKNNFCNFCNRKFTRRCYFTNHMMMKHNINPNTLKQLASIDCKKSTVLSENIELTNEYENKLSVPVINKNNNLNNHVNKRNEKKSKLCMLCNKQFGHLGALTNHMRIHSYKPYKCQYCYMQFTRKGPYITHEKKHALKNVVKSAPSQNKNNIIVEVNDEPQIEHCNDFEFVHKPVDGYSSGTNLMGMEHLWFPCDVCEKKFSTPLQLNVHRKSHSGILPYVCKICDIPYRLKLQWNVHLKDHYRKHNANLKSKQHTNK